MKPVRKMTPIAIAVLCAVACLTSCIPSAQLDADLTKALAKEDQAQSLIQSLETGAIAMLPSIPEPDRTKYQDLIQDISKRANDVFQAKDDAILAAKEQNAERFDLLPFLVRWGGIVEELVAVGRSLKVQKQLLDVGQAKAIRYKAGLN